MLVAPPIVKHHDSQLVYELPLAAWLCDGETVESIEYITFGSVSGAPVVEGSEIHGEATGILVELSGGAVSTDHMLTVAVRTSRTLISQPSVNQLLVADFPIQVR